MGAGNQSSSVELFKCSLAWFRPFSGTAQESAISRVTPGKEFAWICLILEADKF